MSMNWGHTYALQNLLKSLLERLAQPLNVTGRSLVSPPVTGTKTVTSTAAEVFAGASRRVGRYAVVIYNEGATPVYWGPSGVTTTNGYPILAGDSVEIRIDPSMAVPIYAVAPSNTTVRVVELA